MKKFVLILAMCILFSSCANQNEEVTDEIITEAVISQNHDQNLTPLAEETTVQTTAITTKEVTTVEVTTTMATTVATTTAATTKATTAVTTTAATTKVTTATTTAKPTPTQTAHVPSVLEGEYTYGGEPIIEVIDGITYINGILIANKTYSLPETFVPGGLDPTTTAAFEKMRADAEAQGMTLKIVSGYRSYRQQVSTYATFSSRDGKAVADRYSARPGHSEHQSGLAMDLNSVKNSFANTKEGKWLAENCASYGFIIRYPEGKESMTGYMYEPWHIRYIGVPLAQIITDSGLCLEEFLGITSVYAD